MGIKLNRPILVGGLGLTVGIWTLSSLHHALFQFGGAAALGAIALGSGAWWLQRRSLNPLSFLPDPQPFTLDRPSLEKELKHIETLIGRLAIEEASAEDQPTDSLPHVEAFRSALEHLLQDLDRRQLQVMVTGGKSTGKTMLVQKLQENDALSTEHPLTWVETAPLFSEADLDGSIFSSGDRQSAAASGLTEQDQSDLVIFVTDGDLRESELAVLRQFEESQHRVLVAFNKQDQYLPTDRPVILQQLRARVKDLMSAADVVAVTAAPSLVKIRRHQADGKVVERMEAPTADVSPLTQRLDDVLDRDGEDLVLATVLRQSQTLKATVQRTLNGVRRDRALPLIEQSQWMAAGAAFATPMPSLDLLATAAINAQLVMDIGKVYDQNFSLDQAKAMAASLASLMLKLGLVELSTQAMSAVLKANAATFVAGGFLQGLSAAHLTRLAGLTLMDYFEERAAAGQTAGSPVALDALGEKLQGAFEYLRQGKRFQSLVQQGVGRLLPEGTSLPKLEFPARLPALSAAKSAAKPA